MPALIHPSAIVDEGAQIGDGTHVWHFVHVSAGARIGARCSLGQGVFVANDVRIGGVAVNRIEHWEFDQPQPADATVKDASYAAPSVYGFGHPLYYDNVIATLRGEGHAEVDGYEGLRSLEVIIAAYRSARDGVRVGLPLVF